MKKITFEGVMLELIIIGVVFTIMFKFNQYMDEKMAICRGWLVPPLWFQLLISLLMTLPTIGVRFFANFKIENWKIKQR